MRVALDGFPPVGASDQWLTGIRTGTVGRREPKPHDRREVSRCDQSRPGHSSTEVRAASDDRGRPSRRFDRAPTSLASSRARRFVPEPFDRGSHVASSYQDRSPCTVRHDLGSCFWDERGHATHPVRTRSRERDRRRSVRQPRRYRPVVSHEPLLDLERCPTDTSGSSGGLVLGHFDQLHCSDKPLYWRNRQPGATWAPFPPRCRRRWLPCRDDHLLVREIRPLSAGHFPDNSTETRFDNRNAVGKSAGTGSPHYPATALCGPSATERADPIAINSSQIVVGRISGSTGIDQAQCSDL